MPFNITNFRQNIADNGYLKTNNFRVTVLPPKIFQNAVVTSFGTPKTTLDTAKLMTFRAEQIRTPGITLEIADISKYSIGPTRKFPVNAKFQEVEMTILSDGFGNIWQFWHGWINRIFNFTSSSNFNEGAFQVNRQASYTNEYKSEYSTTMGIVIYDHFGNGIMRIDFFEAYPIAFREIQMNWGDNRGLIKLGVTMTFSEYVITGSDIESQTNQIGSIVRPRIGAIRSNQITI